MSTNWCCALWTDQLRSREEAPGEDESLTLEMEIGKDDCAGTRCIKVRSMTLNNGEMEKRIISIDEKETNLLGKQKKERCK